MSRKDPKLLVIVDEAVLMSPAAHAARDALLADPVGALKTNLEAIEVTYEGQTITPTVFVRDGVIHVSAEDGGHFADYYGDFRGGSPWIDHRLHAAATLLGFYWEWVNPGCIAAYKL